VQDLPKANSFSTIYITCTTPTRTPHVCTYCSVSQTHTQANKKQTHTAYIGHHVTNSDLDRPSKAIITSECANNGVLKPSKITPQRVLWRTFHKYAETSKHTAHSMHSPHKCNALLAVIRSRNRPSLRCWRRNSVGQYPARYTYNMLQPTDRCRLPPPLRGTHEQQQHRTTRLQTNDSVPS